jgi:hypothetical protein
MIGDPVTYQLKSDDVVTITLIICVFLVTIASVMIGKPWQRKIAQLPLFNFRQNDAMVTVTPGGIQPFLVLQMELAISILLLDISFRMSPQVTEPPLPSLVLLAYFMLLASAFFIFRWLSYKFVLWMFVPSGQIPLIMESWINSVCFEGVLLLLFLMIDIYFNIPYVLFFILLFIVSFIPRFWQFYWLKKLFCLNLYGSLLIFLYFCALESVPLLFIAFGTRSLNRYLLFNI